MLSLRSRQLFAAAVFLGSTVVLAIQLINPSPVVVTVGGDGTSVAELGGYFRYREVVIIAASACLLGTSGTYLLTATDDDASDGTTERPTPARGVTNGEDGVEVSADGHGAEASAEQTPSDELLDARREEWEETAERLANAEQEVYEVVLDADGVLPQSEIVKRTDISKATVSRSLDSLEAKNLVERKRRGMGNMVLLL